MPTLGFSLGFSFGERHHKRRWNNYPRAVTCQILLFPHELLVTNLYVCLGMRHDQVTFRHLVMSHVTSIFNSSLFLSLCLIECKWNQRRRQRPWSNTPLSFSSRTKETCIRVRWECWADMRIIKHSLIVSLPNKRTFTGHHHPEVTVNKFASESDYTSKSKRRGTNNN